VRTVEALYQCRPRLLLILAGDTEGGDGEFIRMPVLGLTMGIALRIRVAAGWCSLRVVGWLWYEGMYGFELELRVKPESGETW